MNKRGFASSLRDTARSSFRSTKRIKKVVSFSSTNIIESYGQDSNEMEGWKCCALEKFIWFYRMILDDISLKYFSIVLYDAFENRKIILSVTWLFIIKDTYIIRFFIVFNGNLWSLIFDMMKRNKCYLFDTVNIRQGYEFILCFYYDECNI